jgi:hypothetical protein
MTKIPNNIHIIYGLAKNFGWDEYEHYVSEVDKHMKRPASDSFDIIRYLAIKSAHDVNKPDNIFFYYCYEPYGEWWDRAQKYITPVKVEPPKEIFGNPINSYAHQADVIRLQVLIEEGGIYLDSDTLCLKPLTPFLDKGKFVMVRRGRVLQNYVMQLCYHQKIQSLQKFGYLTIQTLMIIIGLDIQLNYHINFHNNIPI